jgi:nicotinic acid mononucleotide adenylyltransferase
MSEYLRFSPGTIQRYRRVQALLDELDSQAEPRAVIVPGSPQPYGGVIIFTGSYNPPTTAHLALLKEGRRYAQQHGGMQVFAAMSKLTVDKESVERPTQLDRIMLLKLLLPRWAHGAGIMLFNRGLYVEQVDAIYRSFPAVKRVLLLIGFDKVVQIFDPRYYNDRDAALVELFGRAELLVAPRKYDGEKELQELLHRSENVRFARHVHLLPFSNGYRNISSTQVRQEANQHIELLHDVPPEVRQFMRESRAYSQPLRRSDGSKVDFYAERVKQLDQLLQQ